MNSAKDKALKEEIKAYLFSALLDAAKNLNTVAEQTYPEDLEASRLFVEGFTEEVLKDCAQDFAHRLLESERAQ